MKLYQRCLIGIILLSTIFSQELSISTLEEIIIRGNSSLKSSEKGIERKSALLSQSRAFPNPEIEIETGVGNNSEKSGVLTQTIMISGKRKHNIRLHDLELSVSKLEYESKKLTILNEGFSVFAEILLLQESKILRQDRIDISEVLLEAVDKKVTAGKLSPAERSRARIQLFQEQSKLREINTSLSIAWKTISVFWENENLKFDFANGNLTELPQFSNKVNLTNSPELHKSELMIEIQKTNFKLEKANAIPNIDFGAGIKNESQGNSYSLGLSIPLPFFNRNKGNINNARIQQSQEQLAHKTLKSELTAKVSNIHTSLQGLSIEIDLLYNEIIPEANTAFSTIKEGYLNGRFTYLDVVDIKEIWFQSRVQYLHALYEYHTQYLALNTILGNKNHNLFGEN